MAIDLGRVRDLIGKMPTFGNYLSDGLLTIQQGLNQLANTLGASPNGTLDPPAPIQGLTVKTDGNGNVHAVINDNSQMQKNLHYFVEYATDPSFSGAHVEHIGVSRTLKPFPLPNFDDNGNQQTFYFRAYSQYPGGNPGVKVNFGGKTASGVQPGGTAQMTLLSSTGSGTAANTGQQPGVGFGKVQVRTATTVKRTSGT